MEDKYNTMCVQLLGKFMAADEDVVWIEVLNKIYDIQMMNVIKFIKYTFCLIFYFMALF